MRSFLVFFLSLLIFNNNLSFSAIISNKANEILTEDTDNLPFTVDFFRNAFNYYSEKLGSDYQIKDSIKRKLDKLGDNSLFCADKETLCFVAVWQKGIEELKTISIFIAGKGTEESLSNIFKAAHIFVASINPELTEEQRKKLLQDIGLLTDLELGSQFITNPRGRVFKYEYYRSDKGVIISVLPVSESILRK